MIIRFLLLEKLMNCIKTDPSRLTAFATCVDQTNYLGCSDLIAWNKYFGWKTSQQSAEKFFDDVKKNSNNQPVGVSEYGAGASIHQHACPSTIIPNVLKENILKNIRQSVTKVIGQHLPNAPIYGLSLSGNSQMHNPLSDRKEIQMVLTTKVLLPMIAK